MLCVRSACVWRADPAPSGSHTDSYHERPATFIDSLRLNAADVDSLAKGNFLYLKRGSAVNDLGRGNAYDLQVVPHEGINPGACPRGWLAPRCGVPPQLAAVGAGGRPTCWPVSLALLTPHVPSAFPSVCARVRAFVQPTTTRSAGQA